jgi:FKBP-type peptidyl-prolyl cis-trans isomerase FklB
MGAVIGNSLKMAGFVSFNSKLFLQAINEVLTEKTTAFKSNQNDSIIRNYFMKLQSKKAAENLITGKKFLEQNKKKDSIVALPSGLQYKIITQGQGESPLITDKVTVNYEGKLLNGKVFDSSKQKGQPVEFGVNGVIKGWTEALQLMKKGSKWILYIPPDLAYGEQNIQGIEPNSVLIFEVELLSIEKENNQNNPNQ